MDTKTYLDTRTRLELAYQVPTEEFLTKVYDKTRIYKADDLTSIFENIKDIGDIWDKYITYLRSYGPDPPRALLYRLLCDRPRIAQELEKLRREKTPPIPLE
jgi:hypothetical protein